MSLRRLERDLDELEGLAGLLESLDASVSAPAARGSRLPGGGSSASRSGGAAAAADTAGDAVLRALLGQDWEAELLDELAAVVDEAEEEDGGDVHRTIDVKARTLAAPAKNATEDAPQTSWGEEEEENGEPWDDDVTALLLGLVAISHQKYVRAPLPLPGLEALPEEARCAAFWRAPWALLVLDDTAAAAVEYSNAAAAEGMLRSSYLGLFGRPAHELAGVSMENQVRPCCRAPHS